jgi:BMFP domain-containing protein YqiC
MGIFDQMKAAQNMMKNMSPDELRSMMKQAEESKKMLEEMVKKTVEEEINKRDLISKEEARRLFDNR